MSKNYTEIELNISNETCLYFKWVPEHANSEEVMSMFINGLRALGYTNDEIKKYINERA